MRKRFHHQRVCSCSPRNGVWYLETRMLRDIVNQSICSIHCASTCGYKALKGLSTGGLCAEARHPVWALKVWKFTLSQIHSKDYDDWIDVWFNTERVRLKDVISDGICEVIGRRIDDVERSLGLSDAQGRDSWEYWAGDGWYSSFFYEKYDADWDSERDIFIEMRDEAVECQHAEQFLHEVQGVLPPQSQNFFDYWNDYNPMAQEDFHFKIDDWD